MSSYLISQAQQLKLTAPVPATLHPAAVYLNSLAVGSRRAMLSSLNAIAELLTSGECDAYALDWSKLRYHHTAAVVAAFRQRYAPATTNKALAALRRVLTEAYRLDLMTARDYQAEPLLEDYQDEIIELFANSTEGQTYLETHSDMGGWIAHLIYYGYCYEGFTLPQMTEDDVQLVLEELFPRKISLLSPEDADDAIPELIAFWQFLKREYQFSNADDILSYLHEIEPDFRDIMNDTSKFGMAKSFFMMGQKAGFDMSTQEGLDEFLLHYNANVAPQLAAEATESEELFPTLPNFDWLEDSDNESNQGFHSPPSAAKKAKQKKRRNMAKASRKRNRQKRK